MTDYNLSEKAVLMRLSIGLPSEQRQDPDLTAEVQGNKGMGSRSGRWVKNLYPQEALAAIKKLDNEARAYHGAVTLPFDMGIGILPAALIMEHGDRMRQFKAMREKLMDDFLAEPSKWIEWAVREHNGTFDPDFYPGCWVMGPHQSGDAVNVEIATSDGKKYGVNVQLFRDEMKQKFRFETHPLPVPNADHFEKTVSSLLGVDVESVNMRVKDAAIEAQRELMNRLMAPVRAMATKLAEEPKAKKDGTPADNIIFRDSLVGNVQEIARLAPKLNLSGDSEIDAFCKEMAELGTYSPKVLRDDKGKRTEAQAKAAALAKRMSGYTL